jgi:hypothetical protein
VEGLRQGMVLVREVHEAHNRFFGGRHREFDFDFGHALGDQFPVGRAFRRFVFFVFRDERFVERTAFRDDRGFGVFRGFHPRPLGPVFDLHGQGDEAADPGHIRARRGLRPAGVQHDRLYIEHQLGALRELCLWRHFEVSS